MEAPARCWVERIAGEGKGKVGSGCMLTNPLGALTRTTFLEILAADQLAGNPFRMAPMGTTGDGYGRVRYFKERNRRRIVGLQTQRMALA